MADLTKDELWKIYDLLPKELKEAVFSTETADDISLACSLAKVNDERISKVARQAGKVLMGLLPPTKFEKALITEAELDEREAKQVNRQIQRLIFHSVQMELASLYEDEEKGETEIAEDQKDIYRETAD